MLQKNSGNSLSNLSHFQILCITDLILQKIFGNFPIKFVPFDIPQYTTYLYCKRFPAFSLSNLPHNYTCDIAKKLRQLPIKFVPFAISPLCTQSRYCKRSTATSLSNLFHLTNTIYYRLIIAKDFLQLPYQICPIWQTMLLTFLSDYS